MPQPQARVPGTTATHRTSATTAQRSGSLASAATRRRWCARVGRPGTNLNRTPISRSRSKSRWSSLRSLQRPRGTLVHTYTESGSPPEPLRLSFEFVDAPTEPVTVPPAPILDAAFSLDEAVQVRWLLVPDATSYDVRWKSGSQEYSDTLDDRLYNLPPPPTRRPRCAPPRLPCASSLQPLPPLHAGDGEELMSDSDYDVAQICENGHVATAPRCCLAAHSG